MWGCENLEDMVTVSLTTSTVDVNQKVFLSLFFAGKREGNFWTHVKSISLSATIKGQKEIEHDRLEEY